MEGERSWKNSRTKQGATSGTFLLGSPPAGIFPAHAITRSSDRARQRTKVMFCSTAATNTRYKPLLGLVNQAAGPAPGIMASRSAGPIGSACLDCPVELHTTTGRLQLTVHEKPNLSAATHADKPASLVAARSALLEAFVGLCIWLLSPFIPNRVHCMPLFRPHFAVCYPLHMPQPMLPWGLFGACGSYNRYCWSGTHRAGTCSQLISRTRNFCFVRLSTMREILPSYWLTGRSEVGISV